MIIMQVNPYLDRIDVPYKDIYVALYVLRTPGGVVMYDTAAKDSDVDEYIVPALAQLGVSPDYVFISHDHADHSGGLKRFMEVYPDCCIISAAKSLQERFAGFNMVKPADGDPIAQVLRVVTIPGHTPDAIGLLDTRTKTLISGDGLQVFGIYGSGRWGSAIRYATPHLEALAKLRTLDIENIAAAHDYHPCGHYATGKDAVALYLDNCVAGLQRIADLIRSNPDLDDERITALCNDGTLPTVNVAVVTSVRAAAENGKL